MRASKQSRYRFLRGFVSSISFFCYGCNALFADVDVTSNTDNGAGAAGTFSAAINAVNQTPSSGPILIEDSASPLSWSSTMPNITTTLSIESDTTGSSRTINGNEHLLVISSGTTTFSSDIILNDCTLEATGGSININGIVGNETSLSISENQTISLSGDNSSSMMFVDIFGGTLQLLSTNSVGMNSMIQLLAGTLESTASGTVSVPQVTLMTNPGQNGIFTANEGSTLLIEAMQVSIMTQPTVPYSTPGITINGPGTVGIGVFAFSVQCSFTVTGVLGGDVGLNLRTWNSTTPVTLNLSGVNTYTGGTYVNEYCTLQLNDNGSLGTLEATVTVGSSSVTNATLTNSGSILASTYYNYGKTNLNGTITVADVFLNYGSLSGCGTIVGNYNSVGVTYTGCSPSALAINGNAELGSESVLSPYLDPSGIASLDVSGNVTIDSGASLLFRPDVGCYLNGFQYDVLSAGGTLTGTFSSVDIVSALLIPHITYGPHEATLTLQMAKLGNVVSGNNAKSVGYALDLLLQERAAVGDDSYCDLVAELIPLSQTQISSILDQLNPALFKGFTIVQENNIVKVRDALSSKNADCACDQTQRCSEKAVSLWTTGIGDFLSQSSTTYAGSPQVGYHSNMGGVVLGVDYRFFNSLYAGLLGAYTNSHINWNNNRGNGNINSGYGGVYLSVVGNMLYGNASIIGAGTQYKGRRDINYPNNRSSEKNSHNGYQLLCHLDTGLNYKCLGIMIRPFDSFDYINQKENAFKESGTDLFNLSVQDSHPIMYRNELGMNFTGCLSYAGIAWILSPKISWVREVRVNGAKSTVSFAGTDETFCVKGFFPNRSLISPGINISGTTWNDCLTLTIYYNGEFNSNYSDNSVGGQVRFNF